ncbi:MAG TPA: ATP-binding protein [Candidatus Saccharimonadales bacterium]
MLALYATRFVVDDTLVAMQMVIPLHSAILAGITVIASLVAYFWAPQKHLYHMALAVFLLFALTTATLLYATGVTTSPFIALGMLVAIFAGLFGAYGLAPVALTVTAYFVLDLLVFKNDLTSRSQIIIFLLAYELPIVISWLLWHNKSNKENEKDKAYSALAQELNQVANKSEIVINGIQDGVIAIDDHGSIQLINPAAQKIVGWGKRDALGLDYHSVLKLQGADGKELDELTNPIQKVLTQNESVLTNDLMLETASGKRLYISLLTSPVGHLGAGAIIVFRDITKEKAEEQQQAEFISTASHEMRTPVASIEGYLGLALNPQTATIDDKARLYLTKAHEAAQHLGRLFQDLLDVSKAEDGRLRNDPKVVDVVSFTQEIVASFTPQAEAKNLILLFKPTVGEDSARKLSPVFYVEVDNDHLREVISNLIENAIKYTREGDVTVDVVGDNEHVTVSVTDTGIGIPPEDVPHLFQKFYRVDNTDTREIGGTGLGLYLSRRLVETMNGRLWVESEYQKGSAFYLELPRISHEEATAKIERDSLEAPVVPQQATPATPLDVTPTVAPSPVAAPIVQPQPVPPPQPVVPAAAPVTVPTSPPTAPVEPQANRPHLFIPPRQK